MEKRRSPSLSGQHSSVWVGAARGERRRGKKLLFAPFAWNIFPSRVRLWRWDSLGFANGTLGCCPKSFEILPDDISGAGRVLVCRDHCKSTTDKTLPENPTKLYLVLTQADWADGEEEDRVN